MFWKTEYSEVSVFILKTALFMNHLCQSWKEYRREEGSALILSSACCFIFIELPQQSATNWVAYNKNVLPHSSGDYSSEIKVLAILVSPKGSDGHLGLLARLLCCCKHRCACISIGFWLTFHEYMFMPDIARPYVSSIFSFWEPPYWFLEWLH